MLPNGKKEFKKALAIWKETLKLFCVT